jgi:predicted nucleic acid-binding protein
VKSLDTNLLIYAANQSCEEHIVARKLAEALLAEPQEWMLADQVLFEYYRALRNPVILQRPLNAKQAAKQVRFLREEAGCLHCAYTSELWGSVLPHLSKESLRGIGVFDAILAVTLQANGITKFYTRNVKEFKRFGLFEVINPF